MKKTLQLFVLVICICLFVNRNNVQAQSAKIDYEKAKQYITESEKQWAEAVASGDSTVVQRILADDFIGVYTKGFQYDKVHEVHNTVDGPKYFKSNRLDDIKVRIYGNMAVAQGYETWVRYSGKQLTGRFVWTDTWLLRNGKWQIVAAEDLIPPAK
ncbi:MAG TPA: nuclear transport factor 2 family protein [Chitinophagaceae bacterium]|nr:nuclear transport factor 2 family protein [Chitinophagaceae bacterium]